MEVVVKNARFLVKNPNEHIQGHWVRGNFYEASKKGMLSYLSRNGYENMRCIDIGASVGNHTVYFSKMLNCEVISIEPFRDSFIHLQENCKLNKINPMLLNIALGSEKKLVSMRSESGEKLNVGMMQVSPGSDTKMDLLDNVVSGQFGFIKIDVEHYNIPLLKGAKNTLLAQKNCHVFIECETEETLKNTDIIMNEYGYKRDLSVILNHTPTYLWKK